MSTYLRSASSPPSLLIAVRHVVVQSRVEAGQHLAAGRRLERFRVDHTQRHVAVEGRRHRHVLCSHTHHRALSSVSMSSVQFGKAFSAIHFYADEFLTTKASQKAQCPRTMDDVVSPDAFVTCDSSRDGRTLLVNNGLKFSKTLECGSMPNVMAALPNIGGALCSTPQSLTDAHYCSAML